MLLCSKFFFNKLPINVQRIFVRKVKQKILLYSPIGRQFYSGSFFQRSITPELCPCFGRETFNEYIKNLSTNQYDTGSKNTLLRPTSAKLPQLYQHFLIRNYCSNAAEPEKKPSIFQRFKQMYKDYWYVLVPVHLVTSAFWFSSFYYLTKSGVDIAGALESIGASEKIVEKMRNTNSAMGYVAVSYALYKIATPVRYTVTLGGTTMSIKYLRDWGYIKPIPPKDKLREMIHDKKDVLLEKKENLKRRFKGRRPIKKTPLKIGLRKS